jgi:hypothetical protein
MKIVLDGKGEFMLAKPATKLPKCVLLLLILVMITSGASEALAVIPSITSIASPPANGYYLQGNTITCSAYVAYSPTRVEVLYRPPYAGRVLSLSSGTLYTGPWTIVQNDYMPGTQSGTSWLLNNVIFSASNLSGSTSKSIKGFVAISGLSGYRGVDPNFYYASPTSSNFAGVATGFAAAAHGTTGTYNCLAYAVDVTTSWQWPWSYNPTYNEVVSYMNKSGSFSTRPGTTYLTASTSRMVGAKVIAYGTSGAIKHFAKVTTWDASGYPVKVSSKWGCWELVNSANSAPFTSVYGSPLGYFK